MTMETPTQFVMPRQAVILCGGLGTRLGELTRTTPKPLLPVGEQPFLRILIQEIARSGIRDFLLLAGHLSDQIESFATETQSFLGSGYSINVAVEEGRAGTGGGLFQARDQIAEVFFLFNGDSYFSCHLHELSKRLGQDPELDGVVALRHVEDSGRFGSVEYCDGNISHFSEKQPHGGPGLINAGVYLFRRRTLDRMSSPCSLEQDILPSLATMGRLGGVASESYFIDIGLPETYEESQRGLLAARRRRAVFFDRDGVVNIDRGHVGQVERFEFMPGAIEAIRRVNEAGYYAFVVTNQAGIAKGKYSLADYWLLRDQIRAALSCAGVQIDDERFCPFHPDGVEEEWRAHSDWRKPDDGMLRDLFQSWPVERAGSFLIGDHLTDIAAAEKSGIPGFLFTGGNLDQFLATCFKQVSDLETD